MLRKTFARSLAALSACAACALIPAIALGQSDGGLTFGSTAAQPATGDAGTLLVKTGVLLGRTLHVKGSMSDGLAGRPVTIERQDKDGAWVATATATTTADGAFDATWTTDHIGRFPLRAVPGGASARSSAVRATGVTPVTVYRRAQATWYGADGDVAPKTACGQTLTATTLGVAHRTLPCGTLVSLYFKGRTITVPVIDRGPFRKGVSWDLTRATADALGFTDTGLGKIGALRLPATPAG